MNIESRTRVPIEGTARSKVYKVITEGLTPIWDTRAIAKESGLTVRQVTIARANLRGADYLPRPTPELTKLTQHTHAATVFPLVKEYREMGLSLQEIQLAVKTEKGKELSYESVHSAVGYNTKVGNVRRLSREENSDIRRDILMLTPEQISRNVITILQLRQFLLQDNLPLPTNRLDLKVGIKKYPYLSRGLPVPVSTDLNRKGVEFSERLIANGLIYEGITWFEALKNMYSNSNRLEDFENLSPEVKLRLEVFARAVTQEVKERKLDLRNSFIELGLKSGKEWFYDKDSIAVKEQRFIADKIRNGKT